MANTNRALFRAASKRATKVDLFWLSNDKFFALLVDLHRRSIGESEAFTNPKIERLSPAAAQEAFRAARNRMLAFLAIAPPDLAGPTFTDLITFLDGRRRIDGLVSVFLSGWSRSSGDDGLRELGMRRISRIVGLDLGDAGLPDVPVLDADGGGLAFVDVVAFGHLGLNRFDSPAALMRQIGSKGSPASASESSTTEDVFKWAGAIASGAIGGYLGKGGGTLGVAFGLISGFVGGRDIGKYLHDGIIATRAPNGGTGHTPTDAGPSDTNGSTTGPGNGDDDDDEDDDDDTDDSDDDDSDDQDADVSDAGDGGGSTGGGDVQNSPGDGGGATDGGTSARDRIVIRDVTLDLSAWSSLAGLGTSNSGDHRGPGSPGGLGLAGLLTPNPETGSDGVTVWRPAGSPEVDTDKPVRMPGPGGLRMTGASLAAPGDLAAAIVVTATGARWRPL